jgi:hypothetical protein
VPDSTTPSDPRAARRRALLPVSVLAAVVVVGGGVAVATAHRHNNTSPTANTAPTTPAPKVTRPYGQISHVRPDQDPNDPVKIRTCSGLAPQGDTTGECQILDWLPSGAPVTMRCWTDDGTAPDGYPKSHHRWFYVTEEDGAPHPQWAGYVYSALIPVPEQTRTPGCDASILARYPHTPDTPTPTPTTPVPTPTTPKPTPPPTPTPTPTPTPPPPPSPTPPQTVTEQSGSNGSPTLADPFHASGLGPKIEPMATVEVICRVYAPSIKSAKPDGWWYKIGGTWKGQYYAVANTFWNGDTPGQKPYTHNTDWNVPECPEQ